MLNNLASSAGILRNLEDIYERALAKGNFSVALKAKELLGREFGLFSLKKPSSKKAKISLTHLSEDDIMHLIVEIKNELSLDPERVEG